MFSGEADEVKALTPVEPELAVGGGDETSTPMPVRGGNIGMIERKRKILGLSGLSEMFSGEVDEVKA